MLPFVLIAYVLAPDATRHVLAQAASEAGPWLTALNLGLAGIGLWAFTTGRIHSDKELQRVVAKLDAAEKELLRRSEEDREILRPALLRSLNTLAKITDRHENTPPPPSRREAR